MGMRAGWTTAATDVEHYALARDCGMLRLAQMSTKHTLQPGECLSSIAHKYGFRSWKTIYDHPDNAAFKKKRPNPNLVYAGDSLVIPDRGQQPKSVAVQNRAKVTFKVKSPVTRLRIIVQGPDEKPIAGKKFEIVAGGLVIKGTTTGEGLAEAKVPHTAQEGQITLWLSDAADGPRYFWTLKIGHLDPLETVEGVQARLNNLGFPCGAVDGVLGRRTQVALRSFQQAIGLQVSGAIDASTRDKLAEVHGKI